MHDDERHHIAVAKPGDEVFGVVLRDANNGTHCTAARRAAAYVRTLDPLELGDPVALADNGCARLAADEDQAIGPACADATAGSDTLVCLDHDDL